MKIQAILQQRVIGLMIILMIGAAAVFGQEFRGTINGSVSDPNGAAVAGATVVIRNKATNVASTVTTNSEGSYSVPFLTPGEYKITATGDGFKTSSRDSVTVAVDDRLTVDFTLEIGTSAEVNVIADAEVLERGSVTVGTGVSQRQIAELPLAEGAAEVDRRRVGVDVVVDRADRRRVVRAAQTHGDREHEVHQAGLAQERLAQDDARVLLDLAQQLRPNLRLLRDLLGDRGTRERAEDHRNGREQTHGAKDVPSQGHETPP